jgi:predicted NAD-dependent protein-ADP-ribosyltransferase YbiA (DUF1768 family)
MNTAIELFRLTNQANYFKFTNPVPKSSTIHDLLLATGDQDLIYACSDRTWGIGFAAADAEDNKESWGENKFGESLIAKRSSIRIQRDPDAFKAFDTPGGPFNIYW